MQNDPKFEVIFLNRQLLWQLKKFNCRFVVSEWSLFWYEMSRIMQKIVLCIIREQQRLRRDCTFVQSCQSLYCSHTPFTQTKRNVQISSKDSCWTVWIYRTVLSLAIWRYTRYSFCVLRLWIWTKIYLDAFSLGTSGEYFNENVHEQRTIVLCIGSPPIY